MKFALTAAPTADAVTSIINPNTVTVGDSLILSVLGMIIVFFMLIILMGAIVLLGKLMKSTTKKEEMPAAPAPAPVASAPQGCVLENVDEKTAALIMAIVAEETKTPLNQLRFISIKEM